MSALKDQYQNAVRMMEDLLRSSVMEDGGVPSPSVFMVMREIPKLGESLVYAEVGAGKGKSTLAVLSPCLVTEPGKPVIPEEEFWALVRKVASDAHAYAIVVGMECGVLTNLGEMRGALLATKRSSDYQARIAPILQLPAGLRSLSSWQDASHTNLAISVRKWLEES